MSLSFYDSFSQCGAAPTSGSTTLSSTNQVVNSYYPGVANAAKWGYTLQVGAIDNRGSATPLANGDMIFIVQMQGADINSSNSNSYGGGTSGNPSGYLTTNLLAGNYEYNVVSNVNAGTITLSNPLQHPYYATAFNETTSTGIQTFQVIRIQREYDLTISAGSTVTAPAWNGSTGGVVVLEVANKLTLDGTVSADGLGFRGGGGKFLNGVSSGNNSNDGAPVKQITKTDYRFNSPITNSHNTTGGAKGEGIAGTPAYVLANGAVITTTNTVEGYVGGSMGWGAPGNAGGGSTDGDPSKNQYNPGGGGGGNGGAGGKGGSGWDGGNGNPSTYNTGGYGGAAFAQASPVRFVLGGGGGAGCSNNSDATTEYLSSGGSGGGIVMIRAKLFSGSGTITANGADANDQNVTNVTDAAGGGGAGGSIIVVTNTSTAPGTHTIKATAIGGNGGDMFAYYAHGPGGGGGGGYVYTNVIKNTNITVSGGAHGLTRKTSQTGQKTNVYNSVNGSDGVITVTTANLFLYNPAATNSPCGALPVTLTMWKGVFRNNKTYLTWQAENAVLFSHFVVEHSIDGVRFSPLGQVAAINSGALSQQYSYEDEYPANGLNYYRLKMVDQDGQYTYSGIITIRTDVKGVQISVTPNPFTDHVVVTIQSSTDETANIRLYNNDGKLVWRKATYVTAGTNVQYYNDLQSLPPGLYIIKVDKGNTTAGFKIVKQ
jgi:hypothetical protein